MSMSADSRGSDPGSVAAVPNERIGDRVPDPSDRQNCPDRWGGEKQPVGGEVQEVELHEHGGRCHTERGDAVEGDPAPPRPGRAGRRDSELLCSIY